MTYSNRVNVYEEEYSHEVVARVKYNDLLNKWDGSNWTNGGVGRHLGITKLRDGRYVLIHGTQWQDEKDYGVIVSNEKALNEILHSNNEKLLDKKVFKDLKELADKTCLTGDVEFEIE